MKQDQIRRAVEKVLARQDKVVRITELASQVCRELKSNSTDTWDKAAKLIRETAMAENRIEVV